MYEMSRCQTRSFETKPVSVWYRTQSVRSKEGLVAKPVSGHLPIRREKTSEGLRQLFQTFTYKESVCH
jgi:hypothetical protein